MKNSCDSEWIYIVKSVCVSILLNSLSFFFSFFYKYKVIAAGIFLRIFHILNILKIFKNLKFSENIEKF